MNNSVRSCLMALATVLILPVPASYADTITLSATLTGALEVPATGSPGTGQATILLDTILQIMEVQITFSGLVNTAPIGVQPCSWPRTFTVAFLLRFRPAST